MNKSNVLWVLFVVAFFSGVLSILIVYDTDIQMGKIAFNLIEECEISIPRNQNCVIFAQPGD